MTDFSDILQKEDFINSVYLCGLETILYISNEKVVEFKDLLKMIKLNAFDFWRILNVYIKYDPSMPSAIKTHFRDLEIRIVKEYAWEPNSPVISVVKKLCRQGDNLNSE